MLYVICSKISPWDCWCWGSPWGQGWSQNSNQRVQIKKVHPPRWSAWKTEGVRCLIGFLSGCLGCGARGQMCFSIRIWLDTSINIKRAKLVFCLSLTLWRTRREIESRKRHIVEHKMVRPFSCAESCKERRWCAYPISKMALYLFWIHTWLCIYLSAAHNATHSYTTLSEWLKWAFIFFWATYLKKTNQQLGGKNLFILCLLAKNVSDVYSAEMAHF